MRDPNYVHVVRLHLSREGASASALFVSPDEEDYKPLIELAQSMGITAEIDCDPAPLCTADYIAEWMRQFDRERTPPPAIERPEYEVRLDELTRAQRSTDRKLDRIAELLADVLDRKAAPAQPQLVGHAPEVKRTFGVPDDAVPPAQVRTIEWQDNPPPRVDRLGHGEPIERGETSQGEATRTIVQQRTGVGGVLPGNMPLVGGSASSEVFVVAADKDGKLAAMKSELPKVGDTLKPGYMRTGE